jgi:hypothetical protein
MRTNSLRVLALNGVRRNGRSVLACVGLLAAVGAVYAQGGTAKPPTVAAAPTNFIFPPSGPALGAIGAVPPAVPPGSALDNGFEVIGQAQTLTVTGGCAAPAPNAGGSVTINGQLITIPTDTIVQFPANTLTWAQTVCPNLIVGPPADGPAPALAFDGSGGSGGAAILPSVEFRVDGNIVGGTPGSPHVAALVYVSQQATNSGSGYISAIDYTDGSIYVASGAVGGSTRLLINDPIGRYGRPQASPDVRFSVDTANPTIKSGSTGYPMCVPRFAPAAPPNTYTGELDPRCPQRNRPAALPGQFPGVPGIPGALGLCRNFTAAGLSGFFKGGTVAPFRIPGADINVGPGATPGGFDAAGYCTGFVMKALTTMPGSGAAAALAITNVNPIGALPANEPDPREQVPFEVGDFITWQGTLVRGGNTPNANPALGTQADLVWVHTIDANVGPYTQPKTLPAYISIGQMTLGVDPQPTGIAVLGVETTARLVLESVTTDVGSILDLYHDDMGFAFRSAVAKGSSNPPTGSGPDVVSTPGAEYFRWLTMEGMTGTCADQNSQAVSFTTVAQPFCGGIQSQYAGPQPGRARIRAEKVPAINPLAAGACNPIGGDSQACAINNSPTRYIRATLRSLCAPQHSCAVGAPCDDSAQAGKPAALNIANSNLDQSVGATSAWVGINDAPSAAFSLPGSPGPSSTVPLNPANPLTCLTRAEFANGLYTGQYMAPVGEFIFPENTLAGLPVTFANTYQLGFLVYGENGVNGNSGAAQVPAPW